MKKIPDNAKKVFEGIIFDVYHWDQTLFDGTTTTFEALLRTPSVTIIATVDNTIIFNREEQPGKPVFTALPGGRVERGDTPLASAKRELLEETGYESDEWEEWFVTDASTISKIEWKVHYFIAKNCKKTKEKQLDAGEKIDTTYITLDALLEKRKSMTNRSVALEEILEKAYHDEKEKQVLKNMFGITE